jgi:hypothetical protein
MRMIFRDEFELDLFHNLQSSYDTAMFQEEHEELQDAASCLAHFQIPGRNVKRVEKPKVPKQRHLDHLL